MNYDECREWLEERRKSMGSVPGLDEVNKLKNLYNNPDRDLKIIHIAGTNGKGSTGYYLENILAKSGIKTGRFLSPWVVDEREIILINSKMIPKTKWAFYLSNIIETVNKYDLKATAFEIETVLALNIFKEEGCRAVIMECGMGGKLDATNVCENDLVDIITSISYDHMNFLGDKLKDISFHKFGIFKPGSQNLIVAPQKKEVYEYLKEYIEINDFDENKVVFADISKAKYKTIKKGKISQTFSYDSYENLILSMPGDFQIDNAVTVLETVNILRNNGFLIKDSAVKKSFENAIWPCRFEIIENNKKTYVLDGAHNMDAVERLFNNLTLYFTKRSFVYIMGMYKDKDYEDVVKFCTPLAKAVVTVDARDRKRSVDKFELGKLISQYNSNVTSADSYTEAIEIASLLSEGNDIVVIFGSLSFLGEMRDYLNANNIKKIKSGSVK